MTAVFTKPKPKYTKVVLVGVSLLVLLFLFSSNDKTYYKGPPRYSYIFRSLKAPAVPIDQALELNVKVGGLVRKSGPLSPLNLVNNTVGERTLLYSNYLRDRDKGWLKPDQPPPCVSPRLDDGAGCRALVNEQYKFIYIHQAHSDSSAIMEAFQDAGLQFIQPWQQNMTAKEIKRLWNTHFVFSFVGNVWQQAINQYETLHTWVDASCSLTSPPNWRDYCFNPLVVGDRCKLNPSCCSEHHWDAYAHMNPQAYCLLTAKGKWAVDFIGHLDQLETDMAGILGEINARRPPSAKPLKISIPSTIHVQNAGCIESRDPSKPSHIPVVYCDKAKYFVECNGECEEHLLQFFAQDIAILHPQYWA